MSADDIVEIHFHADPTYARTSANPKIAHFFINENPQESHKIL